VVVPLALVTLVASFIVHRTSLGEEEIGGWLLGQLAVGGVAGLVWALLAVRIDPGRPGWKEQPFDFPIDLDSLPQRSPRAGWLRWFAPLWLVVTVVAALVAPDGVEGVGDLLFVVVGSAVLQAGGVLVVLLVLALTVWPVFLIVIGLGRRGDGGERISTAPALVGVGVVLLVSLPVAVVVVLALERR
jgi:hypothetical protein